MLGLGLSIPCAAVRGNVSLEAQVASILRKYGTDAHVYLPGIGVINGLTAGNYLDSAGITAATVDNPVGLVLDAANSQLGSELVSNGTFDANITGWTAQFTSTASWDAGTLKSISSGTNAGEVSTPITCVVGKTYKVTGRIIYWNASAFIGASSLAYGFAAGGTGYKTVTGDYSFYFVANATTMYVVCGLGSGTLNVYSNFDNISVKEVTGIHATQATTANKPFLRKGAVNLLTYSEQFDNAAWIKIGTTVSQNAITAPDGTNTADKIIEVAGSSSPRVANTTVVSLVPYTISLYAKAAERTQIRIVADGSAGKSAYFDLSNGVVVSAGASATASIALAINGFYRCVLTYTPSATGTGFYIATAEAGNTIGSGDNTKGVYLWGAQLETGSTASAYAPTTTAAASSPTGNYHWVHDSTDLLTATYPAGYESATIVNALAAGQQTLTAQNIVGAYSIGPSVDTYGRFIFKAGCTASELAIVQQYCNRLAGV